MDEVDSMSTIIKYLKKNAEKRGSKVAVVI
jgi:hypothetical protein